MMQQKYEDNPSLETQLFHGTRASEPSDLVSSEEGFDMRFSNEGMWGRGVYFAESLNYSDRYAYKLPVPHNHVKQVFLAKVLTGVSFKSPPKRDLKMPPTDPATNLRYDSIEGDAGIHIVYENGRSYPEYLISYTCGSPESRGSIFGAPYSNTSNNFNTGLLAPPKPAQYALFGAPPASHRFAQVVQNSWNQQSAPAGSQPLQFARAAHNPFMRSKKN